MPGWQKCAPHPRCGEGGHRKNTAKTFAVPPPHRKTPELPLKIPVLARAKRDGRHFPQKYMPKCEVKPLESVFPKEKMFLKTPETQKFGACSGLHGFFTCFGRSQYPRKKRAPPVCGEGGAPQSHRKAKGGAQWLTTLHNYQNPEIR